MEATDTPSHGEDSLESEVSKLSDGAITVVALPLEGVVWSRFYNRDPMTLSPANPRFMELVEAMRAHATNVSPIAVHPLPEADRRGVFEIAYGHRRLEAAKFLGWDSIGAIILPPLSTKDQARLQLVENSGKADVSVLEQAKQVSSQFAARVWASAQEMASATGKSRAYVQHLKSIGDLVPDAIFLAHPDPHRISYRDARSLANLSKQARSVLEDRIESLRQRRNHFKAGAATRFLLTGEVTKATTALPSPGARISRHSDGFSVQVKGMAGRPDAEVEALINAIAAQLSAYKVDAEE